VASDDAGSCPGEPTHRVRNGIGDICVWRYDHQHWVTQSDLSDKFDWASEAGRWVATFAYFDPYAAAA